MKKFIKFTLISLLILSKTNLVYTMKFEDLNKEDQKIFKQLIELSQETKIKNFVKLLGDQKNFELTKISDPCLVSILLENINKKEKNFGTYKEKQIYALLLYGMLSEIYQQVESKTRIKRFYTIVETVDNYLKEGFIIYPKTLKTLLFKEYSEEKDEFTKTSFYWYFYEKILNEKLKNPCVIESLNWFVNQLRRSILNTETENVKYYLYKIPFLIGMKINGLSIEKFTIKQLGKEKSKAITEILKETKEKIRKKEPSIFSALIRYKLL